MATTAGRINFDIGFDKGRLDAMCNSGATSIRSKLTQPFDAARNSCRGFIGEAMKMGKITAIAASVGAALSQLVLGALRKIGSLISDVVKRVDTLNNFPAIMKNMGISAAESSQTIKYLADKLIGLPTALDDATLSVQRFMAKNGNLRASTEMFLAMNNAIIAGNAPIELQRSAVEQLTQAYSKGKPDMMEWRSMISAMPAQLTQVARSMGMVDADALGASLRDGSVSMNQFMGEIMKLNKEGVDGFASFEQQAREAAGGIATSWTNLRTAIVRGLANIVDAIGQANIAGFIQMITRAVNRLMTGLVALTNIAMRAVAAIAALFGKKISVGAQGVTDAVSDIGAGVGAASDELDDMAGSAADVGTSAKKSAKEAMKALMGFDKINRLNAPAVGADDVGGGGGGGGAGGIGDLGALDFDTSPAEKAIDKIKSKLESFFDPIKYAWQTKGVKVVEAFKYAWSSVGTLFSLIGQSFNAIWQNGTGQTTCAIILQIITNIFNTIGNIANQWSRAWLSENGQKGLQAIWDAANNVLSLVERITKAIENWWASDTAAEFTNKLVENFVRVSEAVKRITDKILEIWDGGGERVFNCILNIGSDIIGIVSDIVAAFAEWVDEHLDVEKTSGVLNTVADWLDKIHGWLSKIDINKDNVGRIIGAVATFGGAMVLKGVYDKIVDIGTGLKDLGAKLKDAKDGFVWLKDHLGDIATKFKDAATNVAELATNLGSKLKDGISFLADKGKEAWDAIAGMAISFLDAAKNAAASAIEFLAAAAANAAQAVQAGIAAAAQWLLNTAFLGCPIIWIIAAIVALIAIIVVCIKHWDDIKEAASKCWDWIKGIWGKVADWFKSSVVEPIKNLFANIWNNIKEIFSSIGTWFKDRFSEAWENIKAVFSVIGTWFKDRWNDVVKVFSVVGTWYKDRFTEAWNNIKAVFSAIGTWAKDRWTDITKVFEVANTWFKDKFTAAWTAIKNVFSSVGSFFGGLWDTIKSKFTNIGQSVGDAVSGAFRGAVNAIIGFAENTINGFIRSINWAISMINKIPGVSVGRLSELYVPRLAQGGFVEANTPQLAVVGDNKREGEIIAPESKIAQAVAAGVSEALKSMGGSEQSIVIPIYLDSLEIARHVMGQGELNAVRSGGYGFANC